jgi:spore germination cell wall hydrolase CwlJ-like protein
LIVTGAAIGGVTAASAAPLVHTDTPDTNSRGMNVERLTQSFADDANLVFGLSFHAHPRGSVSNRRDNGAQRAQRAQHFKFAAAFPTVQPSQFSGELHCLALNIYHEACGESEKGKRAVGHVVMNRVTDRRFPTSVCQVVRQGGERRRHRCQFSWWCDGRSDLPLNQTAWDSSIEMAHEIIAGQSSDPTGGALWYHADYVHPYWRKAFKRGPKIGTHIFYQARTTHSL